ncbi:MAG TPA: phage holin family protein, partial [Gaiellaceae bacterium]|nr:phage holin family protein [Gaiellaceae bacterium]
MPEFGESVRWAPERPRLKPGRLLVAWLFAAIALLVAAAVLPGVHVTNYWGALSMALVVAALNAILPPLVAALRLPFTIGLGFILVLLLNAVVLQAASDVVESYEVDSFWWALAAAFIVAAVSVVLEVIFGTNDDDAYTLRVVQRIARRQGGGQRTDVPGIVYLEIDGLALPVLRRAMRDGNAPTMARWLSEDTHRLVEWEPDLSSQTGASQAGILLGSNENIPAFRWVEKETGTLVACSDPGDCARIEQERADGNGLLAGGGSSRGNLLSGEADEVILTVSRIEAEKHANPGYRAFFANGFNVTRVLVLFAWEVVLEWTAALRAIRRDVHPRGHRGGLYPFMRAAMCVVVRDLIVYGVLTDMMRGRPTVYATFSSYDEVAHHSGLERSDTLEALRKLDQQFGRIDRARGYAPRPYRLVVLSDHGQTQGATFKQRNGYGLDDLVSRSIERGSVRDLAGGDEQQAMVGHAIGEATGTAGKGEKRSKKDVSDREVVVLGSGNLGLVYLMEERRRLTLEEISERHPRLLQALRAHPHVGWVLGRSSEHGAVAIGGAGVNYLSQGRVDGEDPLAS